MNNLELKSVEDIQGMNFFIPSYQRGYRWTRQQVEDLLNDIWEFSKKESAGIYCVQPLVVKKRHDDDIMQKVREAKNVEQVQNLIKGQWEVVDGQQRLTTIFLILVHLGLPKYMLQYETRVDSGRFLQDIEDKCDTDNGKNNIDFYHIGEAYKVVKDWFDRHESVDISMVLLKQVKFIWYEIGDEEDAKQVFARLNIGKISLTNAELIKALLLNKSNFCTSLRYGEDDVVQMYQQEIAMQWDNIEYSLQSKELWLFLNNVEKSANKERVVSVEQPTRIEFIFDLIVESDLLKNGGKAEDVYYGELRTFRYFSYFIEQADNKAEAIKAIWDKVMGLFLTLGEWFDDRELYHYIGFLICCGRLVTSILHEWTKSETKGDFKTKYLFPEIKKCLGKTNFEELKYDGCGDGGPKTNCRPILLLHNIQTVINQNKILEKNDKYGHGVFYKFPFHLFKSEKWDIEHIDSNTTNALNDIKSQREWLLNSLVGLNTEADSELRTKICDFLKTYNDKTYESGADGQKEERDKCFDSLREEIERSGRSANDRLSDEEKNMIWNFVLLDSSTNKSYKNAIFPAKRRVIMGKERGKCFEPPKLDESGNLQEGEVRKSNSAFVPPCTKYVFMKYYDPKSFSPREWNREDAREYLEDIQSTLKEFLNNG